MQQLKNNKSKHLQNIIITDNFRNMSTRNPDLITVFVGENFNNPETDDQSIDIRDVSNIQSEAVQHQTRHQIIRNHDDSNRIFMLFLWIASAFSIFFGIVSGIGTTIALVNVFQDVIILESILIFIAIGGILLACILSMLTGILVCLVQHSKGM